ncbi:uncharacterized protein LOC106080145 [Biomphalaria glabrata]|uniref:Uncharacterized protein LOC106080145 n=1 Tax=Biomphalaria glabrata TaxID=6526 RepID=A0A9W3BAJ1_BIOGL|nr:uncharacterized protein LOC106080145 [Biomphalaria glabrata]
MASSSRTQRFFELIEFAKEKQISKPDQWAEKQEEKEYQEQESEKRMQLEEKKLQDAEKQRQESEKQRQESEKQRQDAEKQRQHEKEKMEFERQNKENKESIPIQGHSSMFDKYRLMNKISAFNENIDNMDSYLIRFEEIATTSGLPEAHWSSSLLTLLTGKAVNICSQLSINERSTYSDIKEALLRQYGATSANYRKKFYNERPQQNDDPQIFVANMSMWFDRWVSMAKIEESYQALRQHIIIDNITHAHSEDIQSYIIERNPTDIQTLTKIIRQYKAAYPNKSVKPSVEENFVCFAQDKNARYKSDDKIKCNKCHKLGHFTSQCRSRTTECSYCHKKGHQTHECWKKQAVSKNQNFDRPTSPTQRYSNREQYNLNKAPGNNKPDNKPRYRSHSQDSRPQYMPNRSPYNRSYYNEHSTMTVIAKSNGLKFYPGFVGDKKVEVLRDTGSTSTLVHERFVHANRFTGNHVQVTAFNGTVSKLPEAIIYVTTPFFSGQTKALVTPNLPMDLILGNIEGVKECTPRELTEWTNAIEQGQKCLAVMTRSMSRQQEHLAHEQVSQNNHMATSVTQAMQNATEPVTSPVASNNQEHSTWTPPVTSSPSLPVISPPPIPECPLLNFEEQDDMPRVSNNDTRTLTGQTEVHQDKLYFTHDDFKEEQKRDPTLRILYQKAQANKQLNLPNKPYFQDGLLVKNAMHKDNTIQQIIVPQKYRKEILATGHNIPHASHMGVVKTKTRILKEFYWPSLTKDIKKYINNCSHCQHDYCEKKQTQKKSNITKTKNREDYKARIDNNESMHHDSSKSTGTSLPTTCPSLPTTCPSLPDNTSPSLPSTFPSLTTDDDFIHQDLNKTASASLFTNTMVCIEHFCYNQDKSHEPEPEADTYLQSTLAIPDKRKTMQLDSTTHTSIPHLKECESTQEAITTMNIGSQRILHELMKSRYFAQEDQVNLLLPDFSNKLFYKWQGPFTITRKISNLLYENNVNKFTRVFHVHMFEHYHETDNEDIKAEVDNFTSLATIPEEEETSSTPIPEIDVSLPASNQIDIPKVITLDDIALQKVKDTKVFPDHADFFTGVSETFPVLQFENNSESNNIDNTKFHPPSTQRATFLQKGTNELLQHCCIDRLNSDMFSHCSIEHSNAKHSATIVLQRQSSSTRKLSFGFGQFLFSPNSNAV